MLGTAEPDVSQPRAFLAGGKARRGQIWEEHGVKLATLGLMQRHHLLQGTAARAVRLGHRAQSEDRILALGRDRKQQESRVSANRLPAF